MKVAILGSSGGMGSYFARRFLEDGHSVIGHDPRKGKGIPEGLAVARSNREAVREADAVLLAVPLGMTGKVGREVAPHIKEGAVIVEMSSVKTRACPELAEALEGSRATLLSIHPMFGPRSASAHPRVLVLGGSRPLALCRSLFPWAELVPVRERDHDKVMAYALALVHALNLAFASSVSKEIGIGDFEKVSSPFGSSQLSLAEAVLSQDPSLYSLIQTENPYVSGAISSFIAELQALLEVVERKDAKEFERRFRSLAEDFPEAELKRALDGIYRSSA